MFRKAAAPQTRREPVDAYVRTDRRLIGVGDLGVVRDGRDPLVTHGLGSCIAVCAVQVRGLAVGMLHFMLPDSTLSAARAAKQPALFADLGIPLLLRCMAFVGADEVYIDIALVGGATIPGAPPGFAIGDKNLVAAVNGLARARLRPMHQQVGGTIARTVSLFPGGRIVVNQVELRGGR